MFPKLLEAGLPVYGYIAEGYWEDVGTHESYMRAQADVLTGQVDVDLDAFEVSSGVWVAEGADVHPEAVLKGPLFVGDYAKVEAGAELREFTVIGSNVIVKTGAFLHRAVVHDNVFIGPQTNLRACVIGKNTDVMRGARLEEGAVVGDECVIEEEAIVATGVRVYPYKNVEAGAVVSADLIFESRSQRRLFGPRGVSGIVNVEITPELAVRLASAWASTLKKGSTVTTSRDVSRAARALKRAVIAALTSSAIDVVDLEVVPVPVARLQTAQGNAAGGVVIRTTPGQPESVDIVFLDRHGADLSQADAAQAGAHLLPRGVPPGVPRRDRRPVVPAPGDGGLHPRAAAARSTSPASRSTASRSWSTPAAAPRRWCCRPCSAGSAWTS